MVVFCLFTQSSESPDLCDLLKTTSLSHGMRQAGGADVGARHLYVGRLVIMGTRVAAALHLSRVQSVDTPSSDSTTPPPPPPRPGEDPSCFWVSLDWFTLWRVLPLAANVPFVFSCRLLRSAAECSLDVPHAGSSETSVVRCRP